MSVTQVIPTPSKKERKKKKQLEIDLLKTTATTTNKQHFSELKVDFEEDKKNRH